MQKISVIVPVYKVEKYLDRCIKSITTQTYRNLEIILVNDGSPDGCPKICDSWAALDSRIIVIHKDNGGLSDARNAGIDKATGEYLTFIDSDDLITPNMIEVLLNIAISEDADIVATTMKPFYNEDPALEIKKSTVISDDASLILTKIMYSSSNWEACGKLYNKLLFSPGLRFLEGKLYEDMHFMPRIFGKAKRAAISYSAMYYYYQRNDSIMGKSKDIISIDLIEILQRNIDFIYERYIDEREVYMKLFASFIVHPTTKLEGIELNNSYKNNIPFIIAYKRYITRNWEQIKNSEYISEKYKIAILISSKSVFVYNKFFKIVRYLKTIKIIKWNRM